MLQQGFHSADSLSKLGAHGYRRSEFDDTIVHNLLPVENVERHPSNANTWLAQSCEPWLQLNVNLHLLAGCSVEIIYEASLLDVLTRPLVRFISEKGEEDFFLPAPIGGRGSWTGRIPEGAKQILISPVDTAGTFGFRVLECRPIGRWQKFQRAAKYHPLSTIWAAVIWCVGYRDKARRRIQRALGTTPLSAHSFWLSDRTRPLEWDGLDTPRTVTAPHLRIVLLDASAQLEKKVTSRLSNQPRSEWSTLRVASNATIKELIQGLQLDDFLLILNVNDEVAPEAIAIFFETHAREAADIYFADERDAGRGTPRFKPDWSPILSQSVDILGTACFYRVDWMRKRVEERVVGALKPILLSPDDKIAHIKRLLVTCNASPPQPIIPQISVAETPSCSVIIPIRDHYELLQQCLDSIFSNDDRSNFEIIIVDNDSSLTETTQYLLAISQNPRVRVLHAPGPFNFSALCNVGAKEAQFGVLVFLNNDTKVLSIDWLRLLAVWACRADIGAVGAKLLFRNEKVQHVGIAMGPHGTAAHFEAGSSQDSAGYFGRLDVPHEISAVTGACLAVERSKFELIGGFDEIHLPVEFSDIDLCLKLREHGFRNLIEPRAQLIHLESASRGSSVPSDIRYRDEIAYFKRRWFSVIRNDPYLHPALSIETTEAALG